jgi:hypothetical protein
MFSELLSQLPPQMQSIQHALIILPTAAALGAALGMIRPIRKSLVPRSSHVIQTQVRLAIVGAVIMLVVAESLPARLRSWAPPGSCAIARDRRPERRRRTARRARGRPRCRQRPPAPSHRLVRFVVAILWLLESIEPPDRAL